MDALLDLQIIQATLQDTKTWVVGNVLVIGNLVQVIIIVTAYFAARRLDSRLLKLLSRIKDQEWFDSRFKPVVSHAELLVLPLTWLILQWFLTLVASGIGWPHHIMTIVVSLLTAWIVIRVTSGLVRDPVWSKVIALTAWTIAALNMINMLDPTIEFLDSQHVVLGELRLSALTVIEGIITLAVFLWVALTISNILDGRIRASTNLSPSIKVLFGKSLKIILMTIAVLAALTNVGIDMTAFAVFGGAIGVGIGFGLQKVVSNLISGLLLLLDKSVKPGDVIAIGQTYGSINTLGARYVSVLTLDGTEHLIPNEELITQRVENWSHSHSRLRIKIPVGIAYDSDVRRAIELCKESANDVERVLDTPPPACNLMGFGDNSVDLEVRCWINDPQLGIANVKSKVLLGIWDRFQENGIEIPFPQRDIHVKGALADFLSEQKKSVSSTES